MALTKFERRWLVYARKVLAQDCGCPCDDDEIAWPGFVGPDYPKGRVVVFGAIHNKPVLEDCGIYKIVPKIKKWLKAPKTEKRDSEYLAEVFAAYSHAIPKWRGTVWRGINDVLAGLRVTYRDIAFANLAKCALTSGSGWKLEKPRIKAHESNTSVMSIIEALEPHYVLIAKETQELPAMLSLKERPGTLVRTCSNMHFTSKGVLRGVWIPQDAAAYHKMMAASSKHSDLKTQRHVPGY